MLWSNFRLSSIFAIATLVAGSFAFPTLAKESIKVQPVLLAQNATVVPESINAEDANAAAETAPGVAIRNDIRTFIDTASPNAQRNISLP